MRKLPENEKKKLKMQTIHVDPLAINMDLLRRIVPIVLSMAGCSFKSLQRNDLNVKMFGFHAYVAHPPVTTSLTCMKD